MPKVAIVMGSDSDFPVLKEAVLTLKEFGVDTEVRVLSAHRTPGDAAEFAQNAYKNGIEVIIAAAGKAAHLAGAMAAHSTLPIIGVPIKSSALDGLDALLSTVQMPPGVPVATVGIDAAKNAALIAIQILSIKYSALMDQFALYKANMEAGVKAKDLKLQKEIQNLK